MASFELFLFSTDAEAVTRGSAAGIDGFIVDWESKGKRERQTGADTEVNHDTPEDLRRVRAATQRRVICRVNRPGPWTKDEVEEAIACGADEILLPMVRRPEEVDSVIAHAGARCGVGILIETVDAVACVAELARRPIRRAYVGLNDLAIERRSASIFEALVDGLVEELRPAIRIPLGLGGLTLPDRGSPIPCRLLIGEMARLASAFGFLRRSWRRDIAGRNLDLEVPRLKAALESARLRNPAAIARDRSELVERVEVIQAAVEPSRSMSGGVH